MKLINRTRPTSLYLAPLVMLLFSMFPSQAKALAPLCDPNINCLMIYAPVCGVDGTTYPNACEASRACVEVAYEGTCNQPPTCADMDMDGYSSTGGTCGPIDCNDFDPGINPGIVCPIYFVYSPVCGVDGNTYAGACEAEQACVEIAYEGECFQEPTCTDMDMDSYSPDGDNCGPIDCNDADPTINPGMVCTTLYAPVCGVDNVTYSNDCMARQACVEITYDGECIQQPICTDMDMDGYSSTGGNCGPIDCNDFDPGINPGIVCPIYYVYSPVCGVDGNTYASDCEAEQACVEIAYEGECFQEPTCTDMDMDGYSPDGGNCGALDCNDADPTVNPGMVCTTLYAPVCGVNNLTYGNACMARQTCVEIAYDGECIQQPICTDNDMDGFALEGGLCGVIDCNDSDPAINPHADENCNGMGDDLAVIPVITKAEYSKRQRRLRVYAESELERDDALVLEGFGAMEWDRRRDRWRLTVNKLSSRRAPSSVTVIGLYGSATADVRTRR